MKSRLDWVYEFCAFLVVVFGLMASAFFSTNHRDLALWSTCAAIVAAVIGGFSYWQDCLWDADAAPPGVLVPSNGATPPYPEGIEDSIKPPKNAALLFLGNSVGYTDKFPFPVITQEGEPVISLNQKDGTLLLSMAVFDADGRAICEIRDNQILDGSAEGFRIALPPMGRAPRSSCRWRR